jgi:predicted DNA-binding protein
VERKQVELSVPGHSSRVPIQVYVDPTQWERFNAVSRAQNRSRSAQIRELIQRDIQQYEAA